MRLLLVLSAFVSPQFGPSDKTLWRWNFAGDSGTGTLVGLSRHHRGEITADSLASDRQAPNH